MHLWQATTGIWRETDCRHMKKQKMRNHKHPIFQELNISIKESDIGAKRRVFIRTLLRQEEKKMFYPFISDVGHDEVVDIQVDVMFYIYFLFLSRGGEISVSIILDLFIIIIAPADVIFS